MTASDEVSWPEAKIPLIETNNSSTIKRRTTSFHFGHHRKDTHRLQINEARDVLVQARNHAV
jgi:hypothetical protein